MKRISKIWWIVIVLIVGTAVFFLFSGNKKKEEVSFVTEQAQKANISQSVTATGTIEPVTSVTVGTQVSGIVSHLFVDYNSEVKKGQVIAELDKTNLISSLKTAQANKQSVQSNLNYQKANYERYKTLYDKGLISASNTKPLNFLTSKPANSLPRHKKRCSARRPTSATPPSPHLSMASCSRRLWKRVRLWLQASLLLNSSPLHRT